MSNQLTVETLKKVVPKSLKSSVSDNLVETINGLAEDDTLRDYFRENIIGFSTVLNTGKFKLGDYVNSVKYCTYKLYGSTNVDAWVKTFPERYEALVAKGVTDKEISSHVAAYSKNILVNRVMEMTMVPSYVYNQDIHQQAILVLADLMVTASSEKVKSDSATSLLTHLKVPEAAKLEIDIGIKDNGVLSDLKKATVALAKQQQDLIASGVNSAKYVAHSDIIEVNPRDE